MDEAGLKPEMNQGSNHYHFHLKTIQGNKRKYHTIESIGLRACLKWVQAMFIL